MVLNQDDVIQILKFLDESSFNELRLEIGDLNLVVNKGGRSVPIEKSKSTPEEKAVSLTDSGAAMEAEGEKPVPPTSVTVEDTREAKRIIEEEIVEQGLIPVKSPMLGTFYRSPKPGDPPFVEVGAKVSEETAVCIIEVMKLFSTIHAGTRGRVTKVCAEDGQLVEYDQVLFLVDKEIT